MKARFEKIRSEQSGFTLVELLIVIVILGILATVVTFGVVNFRQSAETSACEANFASIQAAAAAYRADTGTDATSVSGLSPNYISSVPSSPPNSALTWTAGTPTLTVATYCDTA